MSINAFRTVSTDDAYVNGHVTFVAPRISGQVVRVLVDDNNRVRSGNLLVRTGQAAISSKGRISRKPRSAVAQAQVVAAEAKVRGLAGLAAQPAVRVWRTRWRRPRNQVAVLHAKVAALEAANATLVKTQADYQREAQLLKHQVIAAAAI